MGPFYANGGFFSVSQNEKPFLEIWKNATLRFEETGGDTTRYSQEQAWEAVSGDQGLLNAALSAWDGPVSMIGPEGMAFNNHYFLMAHAVEQPKPWRVRSLLQALRGWPPRRTVELYLANANGAISTMSPLEHRARSISYLLARFVGRFYRRTAG